VANEARHGFPGRTARVLVDVTGIHKPFDYLIDPTDAGRVEVGSEVRVRLGARHVGGWITALDVDTPPGVHLQPVRKVRGVGPSAELVDLARWAAWRWAGHPAQLLRIASPPAVVTDVPLPARGVDVAPAPDRTDPLVAEATADERTIVRLPPGTDRVPFIDRLLRATMRGPARRSAIVACPGRRAAARLVSSLRSAGFAVADLSVDGAATVGARAWAQAAAGGSVVVGTRTVAWAPAPDVASMIIVDEHDEAYRSTRMPTWHARDVLAERARRSGVPFVQLSPCPSLAALAESRLVVPERVVERAGWPRLEIIDRRDEDPRTASSLWSDRLGELLARSGRTVCVLNRTGRVRLLACRACGALTRCETCGAAVHAAADAELVCARCATVRPRVCATCGSAALKNLRIGVSRAREELAALIGEDVAEVTRDGGVVGDPARTRVVIGTEAVLHGIGPVATVVFLDVDQELTAPRFAASEQALALLARAARLLGPRSSGHRLVVQTRLPDHPVIAAAAAGDPSVVSTGEAEVRQALGFPPFAALALVSGAGAAAYVAEIDAGRVDVLDGGDGTWLVRAGDHAVLADVLAGTPRPEARLRIEVDPARV
jgi:primosomal protein N' (replication factor Y)